jgi:very-short-patch-repair endonuclease
MVIEGHEVDAIWRSRRLIVEFDGYATHGTRRSFEEDRRRDQQLVVKGYRVIRVTWRQLTREPEAVVATLATALAA